jgi:hypothetical protein
VTAECPSIRFVTGTDRTAPSPSPFLVNTTFIVNNPNILKSRPILLHKSLVRWVVIHVIVPILGVGKYYDETMGQAALLGTSQSQTDIRQAGAKSTCAPSGLLSFPPEEEMMYGVLSVGCMHVWRRESISSQNYDFVTSVSSIFLGVVRSVLP